MRHLYCYLPRLSASRIYLAALFFFSCFGFTAHAQIISTYAGNGTPGYTGDGGPATTAEINYPWGICFDHSGNLYIAGDWYWYYTGPRVRKVDASGIITTYAGNGTWGFSGDGGPATAAEIGWVTGVTTDAAGNLYLGDYDYSRIRKVNASTGIITTIAGTGVAGYTGDGGPATAAHIDFYGASIAADAAGNVYFYNWGNNRIRKIDTAGIITTVAGTGTSGSTGDGGPATAATIGYDVYGLSVDGSGNLYIADFSQSRIRKVNTSGIISTVAGDGGFGSSGDGGPATLAQIGEPVGVSVDGAGNIYIADYGHDNIRRVDASGTITAFAGNGSYGFSGDGGPATAAKFYYVYDVSTDPNGNVYISDWDNHRVRKVTVNNRPPRFTGGHTQNLTVCENTVGDSINSLLAVRDSDVGQTEIWSLLTAPVHGLASISYTTTSTGGVLTAHSMYYTPATGYSGPDTFRVTINDGYALDTTTIYVTVNPVPSAITSISTSIAVGCYTTFISATSGGTWSSGSTGIATVAATGVVTGVASGTASIIYTLPTGCTASRTVNVFPYAGTLITTVAGNGTAGYTGDGSAATAAEINNPYGTAVDAAGNFYIADALNNRIRKVNTSGVISTFAGTGTAGSAGDGGPATAAQLYAPLSLAFDVSGNMYVADQDNNKVRKISTSGTITTIAGTGTAGFSGDGAAATAAKLNLPTGVTVDASGNVFIADQYNQRVRKVDISGTITTYAGNGTAGLSGDGAAATAAELNSPDGVAVDASGNLYITDFSNSRVRKVNASGIISTFAGTTSGYGGDGGPATAANLTAPFGVVVDALNNVYVSDHINDRIRKINSAGVITTVAGTGTAGSSGDGCGASAGALNTPAHLSVDGAGSVYIADKNNQRIRKLYSNHGPTFVGGHNQTSSVCQNSIDSLNTLLKITDADVTQSETWAVVTPPANGTVVAAYSTTSTGGTITPVGLYYSPTLGFTGADSFTVKVSDCGVASDTTVIHITVTPPPSTISGASSVCTGLTTTLTDPITGGTWSSSDISKATVGTSSGIVSGVASGAVTITYSPGAGCSVTKAMTVTASAVVSGSHNACMGTTLTLTGTPGGGVWASSTPGVATIGSSSGVVSPAALGGTTITYTQGACYTLFTVTVNAGTPAITGIPYDCIGAPQALFVGTSFLAGTWSSASTAIATIDPATGIVTGVSGGSTTMSFTQPSGCYATIGFTVYPPNAPITGPGTVCIGLTDTLGDTTSGGGFWHATGFTTHAAIDSITGILTGLSSGTQTIQFTSAITGCSSTTIVTVNTAPSAITGSGLACVGQTTALGDTITGGTWSSSNPARATVDPTGLVTGVAAGTVTITYSVSGGCYATKLMTVNNPPSGITGSTTVCVGLTTTLSDATTPGTWSSGSPTTAIIGSSSGTVTGMAAGIATITYTATATGCTATRPITVNTSPAPITGTLSACVGQTTALADATTGGTWSSGTTTVATVGSTGIVSGAGPGTSVITYSLGAGCSTSVTVTVSTIPSSITGSLAVCAGSTTTLSDATPGGSWSATGSSATIGSTGTVSGVSAGTATVSYTVSGCARTATVTVNPVPAAITGPSAVCVSSSISVGDVTPGGTWSSSNISIATAGTTGTTGTVTGVAGGTVSIMYTLPTTCSAAKTITVNTLPPPPTPISGPFSICQGMTLTMTDATGGGTWTVSGPATIGSTSGMVTGTGSGMASVSYTMMFTTGCSSVTNITINPVPVITGPTAVCVGATIPESSTPGGFWSSGTTGVATIGTSGIVFGVSTGTSVINYALPTGCASHVTVTVSLSPTAITGPSTVCTGATSTFTDGVGGGVWSSSTGAVSVGSLTGDVTGVTTGVTLISYSLGSTGCTISKPVTVIASPGAISGTTTLCMGASSTLTSTPGGGVWSSSSTGTATIGSSTGSLSGVAAGTSTISYTYGGCSSTATATINTTPVAIGGPSVVCIGSTIIETDGTPGGTWSTPSSNISIGSTGTVSGISGGTATVVYTLGSCSVSRTISVNAVSSITGATGLCVGATSTLSDAGGGTWSSGTTGVATVGSSTGVVSGLTPGTSVITYTLGTGCTATTTVTVNTAPGSITGSLHVCTGATTPLGDPVGGGLWISGSTNAAVGSLSGIVTGVTAGPATISYSLGSGCTTTAVVTVQASPAGITGTTQVCQGSTIALGDITSGGTWSSGAIAVATVGSSSGTVNGVTAGTATISYTLANGCAATSAVTVNALPGAISGALQVCSGLTSTLTDPTTGGTWSSGSTTIATVGSITGTVTGGTPGTTAITYTLSTGCHTAATVTVNSAPLAIIGSMAVCIGSTTTLSDPSPGGSWSSATTTVATVGSSTGTVSGGALGTATISYTVGGCPATAVVTVNPLPGAISGSPTVCAGATTPLTDATTGGAWSSSNTLIALVDAGTGVVTGVATGPVTITYSMGAGCTVTAPMTVNPAPAAITGSANVCMGATTTLSDVTIGGVWASGNTSVATIGSSGTVSSVAPGTTTISYTIATGCSAALSVAVVDVPPIMNVTNLCAWGDTVTINDANPGGIYTSSLVTVSNLGGGLGLVTALAPGSASIIYTLAPSGCTRTVNLTVNPIPAILTGNNRLCTATTTTLSDATPGGTWSSTDGTVATVGSLSGTVTGVHPGTAYIVYTLATGCKADTVVDVQAPPAPIAGAAALCAGATSLLSDTVSGGTWSSSNPAVATVVPGAGLTTGVAAGTATITYAIAPSCAATKVVTIEALPSAFTVTGGGSYCAGSAGSHVGLSGSASGVNYQLYNGSSTTGSAVPGTGSVLDFGPESTTGTYSVSATDASTGCSSHMSGTVAVAITATVTPSVSLTVNPGTTQCIDTLTSFVPVPVNGGASPAYQWAINGVSTTSGSTFSYIPLNGDVLSVTMTSNAACAEPATATASVTMTIGNPATPVVTITAHPGTTLTTGEYDTLTATVTSGGAAPTYQWEVNSVPVAGAITATYITNTLNNKDTVQCIVHNTDLCGNSAIGYVTVTVTTNSHVGINTIRANDQLSVAPNPNTGVFTIKGNVNDGMDEDLSIEVTDMLGQVVYRGNATARAGKLDTQVQLHNIANGMYLLNVRGDSGTKVFHIVVEQ